MKKFMIFLITLAIVGGCSEGDEPNPGPPVIPPPIEYPVQGIYELNTWDGHTMSLPQYWTFGPDTITLDEYWDTWPIQRKIFKVTKWHENKVEAYWGNESVKFEFRFIEKSDPNLLIEWTGYGENMILLTMTKAHASRVYCPGYLNENSKEPPLKGAYVVYSHNGESSNGRNFWIFGPEAISQDYHFGILFYTDILRYNYQVVQWKQGEVNVYVNELDRFFTYTFEYLNPSKDSILFVSESQNGTITRKMKKVDYVKLCPNTPSN